MHILAEGKIGVCEGKCQLQVILKIVYNRLTALRAIELQVIEVPHFYTIGGFKAILSENQCLEQQRLQTVSRQ